MQYNKPIYFHTNVPAPYRRHQFELISKRFPHAVIYLIGKQAKYRPWSDSVEGWRADIRQVDQKTLIWSLIKQRWGSVHVCAYAGGKIYWLLLMLSGVIGHSKVLGWSDGQTLYQIEESRAQKMESKSIKQRILKWLCAKGQCGIFVSGQNGMESARLIGYKDNAIINAYLSHDVEKFVNFRNEYGVVARKRIRETLGIENSKVVILTISRFLSLKRIEDVSKALVILEEKYPRDAERCEFILIGDGEDRKHEQYLSSLKIVKAHTIPQMPPGDVLAYYCATDMFVFPSEGDVWGLVVNEALSMGLPVVCTDVIGAAELVKDGVNGYKVQVRQPDAIAGKIRLLLDDARRDLFSKNAMGIKDTWRSDLGLDGLEKFLSTL